MFDPNAIGLEWIKETDLAINCVFEIALGELEDGEQYDGDGAEDWEENLANKKKNEKRESREPSRAGWKVSGLGGHGEQGHAQHNLSEQTWKKSDLGMAAWDPVDSPEEHVEEESVEVESEENPLGQMEELTPKLMLVCIPGTGVPQPSSLQKILKLIKKTR